MSEKDDLHTCRMKTGLREIGDKWYVVVSIWKGESDEGEPFEERIGPPDGLATKADALVFYHESVRPVTELLITEVEKTGVSVQRFMESRLH